jgi:phosphate:Na+ symporter
MGTKEAVFLGFSILGGVGLFILGMSIMTDGLRQAAGERLRVILSKATRSRYAGVLFGTALGFLIHSSAASVMMIGFINAGLMNLVNAIPLLMGASIGTTLSMQLISFRLTEYAFFAIAIGFLCQMLVPVPLVKHLGRALLGFGLLFLGLDHLGGSIEPYREQLAPWLTRIDGSSWSGMFFGVLIAASVTLIIQSSGATIGMLFAMISAGIFTSLEQAFPIVLGAHIGTAGTGLLASIGTNLEARRAALANLLFQFFNVGLAIAAAPLFIRVIAATSDDLVRQTANMHTAVMVVAVVVLLPVVPLCAAVVARIAPYRGTIPQRSFLEREYVRTPERAVCATLQELRRALDVCRENYRLARELFRADDRRKANRLRLNEGIVNEIKAAVKGYLAKLSRGYLSRRQALMVQYLSQAMSDIERVGDHVESLYEIRQRQAANPEAAFDVETAAQFRALEEGAEKVLTALAESLTPENPDFNESGGRVLTVRDSYDEQSLAAKAAVNGRVAAHQLHPLVGLFFSEYVSALDRIVKHCKMIAREEQQPFFRIKSTKMGKVVEIK